jgi:hypothetical protein
MGDEKALIKVDDLAGLSKPADTLIKKISKAIGGLYLRRQIRKVARAKADATIIEVQRQCGSGDHSDQYRNHGVCTSAPC